MVDKEFKDIEEVEVREENGSNNIQNFFNNDFLLLLIILFIFFGNTEVFSKHFHFINGQVKQIRSYLEMADATIQALDQASQIPNQMLK
jgi:Trk-type K+ transport system membrane component